MTSILSRRPDGQHDGADDGRPSAERDDSSEVIAEEQEAEGDCGGRLEVEQQRGELGVESPEPGHEQDRADDPSEQDHGAERQAVRPNEWWWIGPAGGGDHRERDGGPGVEESGGGQDAAVPDQLAGERSAQPEQGGREESGSHSLTTLHRESLPYESGSGSGVDQPDAAGEVDGTVGAGSGLQGGPHPVEGFGPLLERCRFQGRLGIVHLLDEATASSVESPRCTVRAVSASSISDHPASWRIVRTRSGSWNASRPVGCRAPRAKGTTSAMARVGHGRPLVVVAGLPAHEGQAATGAER